MKLQLMGVDQTTKIRLSDRAFRLLPSAHSPAEVHVVINIDIFHGLKDYQWQIA